MYKICVKRIRIYNEIVNPRTSTYIFLESNLLVKKTLRKYESHRVHFESKFVKQLRKYRYIIHMATFV